MGVFKYGDPSTGTSQLLGPRPPCWGTSKYDNEDRECRGCGFQNTCRDYIMKSKPSVTTPAPAPVASYFSQFTPQTQYATPQVVVPAPVAPVAPQVIPVKPAPAQAPTPVQARPAPQPVGPVIEDRYGQFQDPMFHALKSTPTVLRPQLPSENFAQRVAKNMLLASVESALGEMVLGVRQFLWTPKNDKDK